MCRTPSQAYQPEGDLPAPQRGSQFLEKFSVERRRVSIVRTDTRRTFSPHKMVTPSRSRKGIIGSMCSRIYEAIKAERYCFRKCSKFHANWPFLLRIPERAFASIGGQIHRVIYHTLKSTRHLGTGMRFLSYRVQLCHRVVDQKADSLFRSPFQP